ncbi:MAG: GNAT family N-acetyltransferase [Halococcoides sp.]
MTHKVDIRDIQPDDRTHLSAIQQAALDAPSPRLLAAAVDGLGIGLVAVTDRPVGYAYALLGDDVAYVPEIAVEPSRYRQGIGTALLEALLARVAAAAVAEIRLTVRATDERARAFYRTNGFSEREHMPDYYETEPTGGIVLSRPV